MDLRKAGIGKASAALVAFKCRRDATPLRVSRKVEYIAVAARAEKDGVRRVPFNVACDEVADDYALAWPLTTTKSSISRRVYILTF